MVSSLTGNLYERQMQHYSQEFKNIANRILVHLNDHTRKCQKKLLLIIVDGLDKLLEKDANRLFHGRDDVLSQLNSNFIISFPVFLQYSPNYRSILLGYDEKYALSMIMVRHKDGTEYETGRDAIEKIVEKRMNIELFENKELLWEMIQKSGGNLRDLFRLIRIAAINAMLSGKDRINKEAIEDAYTVLRKEFGLMLTEANISLLNKLYLQTEKKPIVPKDENDKTLMQLLNSDMIIEYNDVNSIWCDLHPLVADIIPYYAPPSSPQSINA